MTKKTKVLCTFPGKFGDILWSLATAKHIAEVYQTRVDFAVMPSYPTLLLLIERQDYINRAFVVDDWHCIGSPCGDQPYTSPAWLRDQYDKVYDLGYHCHPSGILGGPNVQLIDFIANQQGYKLVDPLPFMTVSDDFMFEGVQRPYVSYAFNEYQYDYKMSFLTGLAGKLKGTVFVDAGPLPWIIAAAVIKNSVAFVGCRSANWVVANGFKKPCAIFEPHPERNATGNMGSVFGCSYNDDRLELNMHQLGNIELSSRVSADFIRIYLEREAFHENVETVTRGVGRPSDYPRA